VSCWFLMEDISVFRVRQMLGNIEEIKDYHTRYYLHYLHSSHNMQCFIYIICSESTYQCTTLLFTITIINYLFFILTSTSMSFRVDNISYDISISRTDFLYCLLVHMYRTIAADVCNENSFVKVIQILSAQCLHFRTIYGC
jgi:hypothetical protein